MVNDFSQRKAGRESERYVDLRKRKAVQTKLVECLKSLQRAGFFSPARVSQGEPRPLLFQ